MHHPDIVLNDARGRQRELITQAERRSLIATIRRPGSASRRGRSVHLIETIGG